MRCAGILAELGDFGVDVGRVDGRVVEAYPAAALRTWGLVSRGNNSAQNRVTLGELVDALLTAADWMDLGAFQTICRESDDALDAVLAAVIARAAAVGCTALPEGDDRAIAEREGWIHVPTGGLQVAAALAAIPATALVDRPRRRPRGKPGKLDTTRTVRGHTKKESNGVLGSAQGQDHAK